MQIYGLLDPETGELRYVGKTAGHLDSRLRGHLKTASLGADTYKNFWIKKLLRYGLIPKIHSIQFFVAPLTSQELDEAEIYWIKFFREQGCRLTNGTDGGEGLRNPTSETRAKISAASRGHCVPDELRKRISKTLMGRVKTNETRLKLSQAHLGRIHSEERRANNSAAQIGKKLSDAHKEKLRVASTGRKHSEESKAKMSLARKNRKPKCQ